MKTQYYLLAVLLLLEACGPVRLRREIAESGTICGTVLADISWKYCFTPGKGDRADILVYYFHGGGGSEFNWIDPDNYTKVIRDIWSRRGADTPSVISVSFGKMWLLTDKSPHVKNGLYGVFTKEIIPHIEGKLLQNSPRKRIILGESMGGFNGGVMGLRNPEKFHKIALICPGVSLGTESDPVSVDNYMQQTGAKRSNTEQIFGLRKDYFSTWQDAYSQSPLELLRGLPTPTSSHTEIFLSCGNKDEFGFFAGAEEFANISKKKGLKVTWRPISGGHCSMDIEALSKFITD